MNYPNPDIENTFIAQSLDTSSKSKKCHITNKVTRYFVSSLYAPMVCTLIRVSISGLGNYIKTQSIISMLLFANASYAQLIAVDDDFSVPNSGLLIVESQGVLENDSLDGETGVDGLSATLVSDVNTGLLECVIRNGDDIISQTPGICSDGSFDYTIGNDFEGIDSFTYQVSFSGEISMLANVSISACSKGPQIFTCWKEIPYLEKLSQLGYNVFLEGFDGSAWEAVRHTTSPSITSKNITWTTNFPTINGITTGSGGALSGTWSGYDSNHGYAVGTPGICDVEVPPLGCFPQDGLSGSSSSVLYGIGGYVSSPVPGSANISIIVNAGVPNNIGKMPGHGYDFFGMIDTNGFTDFEFREIDGKIGQEVPIFMDDIIIGTLNPIPENTPPVFTQIDDITIEENQYITLEFSAIDQDDGDSLHFYPISTIPSGASFYNNFDGTSGFNWRPNIGQVGNYPLSFIVTDNGFPMMSDTLNFQITVEEAADPDLIFKNDFE